MKWIYFFISIFLLSTFAVAVPINLQITANYYSHTLEFEGTFASTNIGNVGIPKGFSLPQISLPSTTNVLSSLVVNVKNMPEISTINKNLFPVRDLQLYSFSFFTDSQSNVGLDSRTPLISTFIDYNYTSMQLNGFSAGFNLGPISIEGSTRPQYSQLSLTFPNGFYVDGILNQSTGTFRMGLPIMMGNFLFQPEGQYIFPSNFNTKISLFYMNDGIIPYAVYDGESTPTFSIGVTTLPFSAYAKMTILSTPIYSVGTIYRSAFGIVGADISLQQPTNWVNASFNSVPFGIGNLQFEIAGDGQIVNNGTYKFRAYLTTSLNLFSSVFKGWVGMSSDSGNYKTLWGMDVNF
ncbi:hypothetical protein [Athalassotoga saccharophila]|uniref:hypothetical protein n=1 Tax=Athalassotoga saccharophila TaxID=1441386 RepID=UPI001379A24E|nr:hypothetical protein [Athalassotoga saccharophila]